MKVYNESEFDAEIDGKIFFFVIEQRYPEEEDEEDPDYIEDEYVIQWLHCSPPIMGENGAYVNVSAVLSGKNRYLKIHFPAEIYKLMMETTQWNLRRYNYDAIYEKGAELSEIAVDKILQQLLTRYTDIWYFTALRRTAWIIGERKISTPKGNLVYCLHLVIYDKEDASDNEVVFTDTRNYLTMYATVKSQERHLECRIVKIRQLLGKPICFLHHADFMKKKEKKC